MSRYFLKKVATIVASILIVFYVGYQLYISNYSPVKTETVVYTTVNDVIETTGYVVRNETIISQDVNGIIEYQVNDGDKVSSGGAIAKVYGSAQDAFSDQEVKNIDAEVLRLTQIGYSKDSAVTGPNDIDRQVITNIRNMSLGINRLDFSNISESRNNLLYLIDERQVITGKVSGFNDIINKLKAKKNTLLSSSKPSKGVITAPSSGYFVSKLDGYENAISYNDALMITPEQIKKGITKSKNSNTNIIGKISDGLNWYVLGVVSPDSAFKLSIGKNVTLKVPFVSSQIIPGQVVTVNQKNRDSEAVVVIKCNYMNNDFALIRNEHVQIICDEYSGIRVSKKALHEDTVKRKTITDDGVERQESKRVQGVYVVHGGELIFKQVVPLYSRNDYIVCDCTPNNKSLFNGETVQLYDQVIVGGTELYNGKVIR